MSSYRDTLQGGLYLKAIVLINLRLHVSTNIPNGIQISVESQITVRKTKNKISHNKYFHGGGKIA